VAFFRRLTPLLIVAGSSLGLLSVAVPARAVVEDALSRKASTHAGRSCRLAHGAKSHRHRGACASREPRRPLVASLPSATFGKTTVGGSSDSFLSGRKRVSRYALTASGEIDALVVYLAPTSTAGQQGLGGVIYSDVGGKPDALLGVSEQLTFTNNMRAGWYDLHLAAPLRLRVGNYWIGVITGASSHVAGFRYDSVSGSRDYNANPLGSGPSNPFGLVTTDSEQMSLYAAYTSASVIPSAPVVTAVSPASGPQAGGTSVRIAGANLAAATGVKFGSASAVGFTVNSANSITAVSPAGAGTVDVTVTTPAASSAPVAADRYTYTLVLPPPPPPPPPTPTPMPTLPPPAPTPAPPPTTPPSAPGAAGEVRFVKTANSAFDGEAIEANGAWMREHFARVVAWSPFFDTRTRWYENAWVYQDAYAIYVGSELAREHPEWILHSASGEPLYIPYGHPPVQFAADVSNPAFRKFWIDRTRAIVARGYRGVFVDDVDMWANVGNVRDERQVPISGATGRAINDEAWREYFTTFLAELRAALPGSEIVDNSVWYAGALSGNRGTTNPLVRSQIESANAVNIEHGPTDSGLTGGTGSWSLYNLFTYIDEVHALGRAVKLAGSPSEPAAMEYGLAAYLLISTGRDFVSGGGASQTVSSFWPGWQVNLGEATSARERASSGLWKRSFRGGMVYLLEPGAATQTVALPAPMHSATLGTVTSITLSARQAAVLVG
jgi:hypothetical protein